MSLIKKNRIMKIEYQYPITWPSVAVNKHKIPYPRRKPTLLRALRLIEKSAAVLKITKLVISTNHVIEKGIDRGHNNRGPAVAVYFLIKGVKYYIASDKYFLMRQNLYACAKTLEGYAQMKTQKTIFKEYQELTPA